MEPINYQVADPSAAVMNGVKLAGGLQGMQFQTQENDLKLQQQKLAQQQALQMQADLRRVAMNPNAGHADYSALMTMYPSLAEHLGKAYDVLDKGKKDNALQFGSQVYSALLADNSPLAKQMLDERAKADPANAQQYTVMSNLIEHAPQAARAITALSLGAAMGPDKFATAFQTLGTEARADQKQPLEVRELTGKAQKAEAEGNVAAETAALANKNIASQIGERAARLSLDQDKLKSEVQLKLLELGQKQNTLDDGARKIINDSTVASVAASQSATQMSTLADKLEQADPSSGLYAKGKELFKRAMGDENAVTALRQEYTRLRTGQAIKMLPPGPASDKDVALALKGFPDDTADAKVMASFLRGMAKLQQQESLIEGSRAEWVNAVGHSGKPKTDITIDGITVPAGTTYPDFIKNYLPKAMQQQAAQQVQGRSYMRFATPQAAPQPSTGGATGSF